MSHGNWSSNHPNAAVENSAMSIPEDSYMVKSENDHGRYWWRELLKSKIDGFSWWVSGKLRGLLTVFNPGTKYPTKATQRREAQFGS